MDPINGEISFGEFTLSTIVSVIMGAVFTAIPSFPDRLKNLVAMMFGVCLGLLGIFTAQVDWNVKNVILFSVAGLMYGVQAIGTYNVLKKPNRIG